jgi:exopolysaccharide biosynthesis polyprenyl glycosylphosphotransferase
VVELGTAVPSAAPEGGAEELRPRRSTGGRLGRALEVLLPSAPGRGRDSRLRRLLALADVGAVVCAVLGSLSLSGLAPSTGAWFLLFLPLLVAFAKCAGLYDRDQRRLRHLTVDEAMPVAAWSASVGALFVTFATLLGHEGHVLEAGFWIWLLAGSAALVLRATARSLWRAATPRERTLLVGAGELAAAVQRKVELFPDMHLELAFTRPTLGLGDLEARRPWLAVDRIVFAADDVDQQLILPLLEYCRKRGVKLTVVPFPHGLFGSTVQLHHVGDLPLVEYNTWHVSRSTLLLKRLIDVVGASLSLVLLAPLLAVVAVSVRLACGPPVLFRQLRIGLNGRSFQLYKFRTMVVDAERVEPPASKLADDPRVTRLGRLLRRWSLDELPQLINVLLGQMSLVGPRPEESEVVERYRPEHRFRLAVKPGLTGPMQVNGRGALSLEERLSLERDYIENLSIGRDLRILLLTAAAVLSRRGAY